MITVVRDSIETIEVSPVTLTADMTALAVQVGLAHGLTITWTTAAWSDIVNNGNGTWTATATTSEITFSAANYPRWDYAVRLRVNAKNIEHAGRLKII